MQSSPVAESAVISGMPLHRYWKQRLHEQKTPLLNTAVNQNMLKIVLVNQPIALWFMVAKYSW